MPADLTTLRAERARLDARLDEARARLRSAADPVTIEECLVEEATVAIELLADRASLLEPNALAAAEAYSHWWYNSVLLPKIEAKWGFKHTVRRGGPIAVR